MKWIRGEVGDWLDERRAKKAARQAEEALQEGGSAWQISINGVPQPGLYKDYATFRRVVEEKVKAGEIDPDAKITVTKVKGRPQKYDGREEKNKLLWQVLAAWGMWKYRIYWFPHGVKDSIPLALIYLYTHHRMHKIRGKRSRRGSSLKLSRNKGASFGLGKLRKH